MIDKRALKTVVEYNKLPKTKEKDEIDRQFLSDEIGHYEFFCLANSYLEKVKQETA